MIYYILKSDKAMLTHSYIDFFVMNFWVLQIVVW